MIINHLESKSELVTQNVDHFENDFTHELAWNVLKDYLEEKGIVGLIGSKDATRLAFKNGLIEDGESWMKMIEDRNKTSHTYDLAVARAVVENILKRSFTARVPKEILRLVPILICPFLVKNWTSL